LRRQKPSPVPGPPVSRALFPWPQPRELHRAEYTAGVPLCRHRCSPSHLLRRPEPSSEPCTGRLVEPTQSARTPRLPLPAPSKVVALEFFQKSISRAWLIDGDSPKSNFCVPDHGMTPARSPPALNGDFFRKVENQPNRVRATNSACQAVGSHLARPVHVFGAYPCHTYSNARGRSVPLRRGRSAQRSSQRQTGKDTPWRPEPWPCAHWR